jgi:ubiquinol oxidase
MYTTRAIGQCTHIRSGRSAVELLKSLSGAPRAGLGLRSVALGLQHQPWTPAIGHRSFSTSHRTQIREFFPEPDSPSIKKTEAAWPHPMYTPDQMAAVQYSHRECRTFSDRLALTMVRILRWGLDFASGYRHSKASKLANMDPVEASRKYGMTERKYLTRNIFLESVAGVPGMVAAMLRHLRSMRNMKRDNGWIETLLEESYNERMHLLIFLKMGEPGWFMRLMVLGAQGVFFNALFISYLLSPRTVHRFVSASPFSV